MQGYQKILLGDCGTEYSVVAYLQPFLYSDTGSFQYGRSVTNQVYFQFIYEV